jgi:hypothetical protein
MSDLTSSAEFANNLRVSVFAGWLITGLLVITGFQRIKEIIAFVLLKLYEFFIQKNALSL